MFRFRRALAPALFLGLIALSQVGSGATARTTGDEAAAEKLYSTALEIYQRGASEDEPLGEWLRQCEDRFEEVIDRYPDTDAALAALYARSLCQSRQRRYEIAIAGLEEFLARRSENVSALRGSILLAECHGKLHEWERSVAIYQEILREHPTGESIPDVLFELGSDLRDLGRLEEAKGAWERLAREFPDSEAAERAADAADTLAPARKRLAPLKSELQRLGAQLRPGSESEGEVYDRMEAVLGKIGEIHAPESEEFLIKLFGSASVSLRALIVPPLLEVASPAAAQRVLGELPQFSEEVQVQVLRALHPRQLAGEESATVLKPWLAPKLSLRVRSAAISLLGRVGSLESTESILAALEPAEEARPADLEGVKVAPIVRALRDAREPAALEHLAALTLDEGKPALHRLVAASALGGTRSAVGVPALSKLVAEVGDAALTQVALDALRRRRATGAAEDILAGLERYRTDRTIRTLALETLLELRASLPGDRLIELGRIDDLEFRRTWVRLLALNAHQEACYQRLLAALADPAWQVREIAIAAVSGVRRIESIDALVARLAVEEPALAALARPVLRELIGVDFGPDYATWESAWKAQREVWRAREEEVAAGRGYVRGLRRNTAVYFGVECGKHTVFLIDGSASMRMSIEVAAEGGGAVEVERMSLAREELAGAIDNMDDEAHFNVVVFNDRMKTLWQESQRAKPGAIAKAKEFIGAVQPSGPTDIHAALEFALSARGVDTIFLLTDGEPSAGKVQKPDEIIEALFALNREKRIPIHTIALGDDSPFLARLARLNYGAFVRAARSRR